MSHVVKIAIDTIRDLDVLEKAVRRLGGELCRGQTTYTWWGRWVNDYHAEDAAYRQGVDVENYGKCDHAIRFPGAKYEVGVVADQAGGFGLIWDYVDRGLYDRLGGMKAKALIQAYHVELQIAGAYADGATCVTETHAENGDIILEVEI